MLQVDNMYSASCVLGILDTNERVVHGTRPVKVELMDLISAESEGENKRVVRHGHGRKTNVKAAATVLPIGVLGEDDHMSQTRLPKHSHPPFHVADHQRQKFHEAASHMDIQVLSLKRPWTLVSRDASPQVARIFPASPEKVG